MDIKRQDQQKTSWRKWLIAFTAVFIAIGAYTFKNYFGDASFCLGILNGFFFRFCLSATSLKWKVLSFQI